MIDNACDVDDAANKEREVVGTSKIKSAPEEFVHVI